MFGSNRLKKIAIYVGVFALIAFAFAMQSYMTTTLKGKEAEFFGTLRWAVSDWGPRMVLFPIVIFMASHYGAGSCRAPLPAAPPCGHGS